MAFNLRQTCVYDVDDNGIIASNAFDVNVNEVC